MNQSVKIYDFEVLCFSSLDSASSSIISSSLDKATIAVAINPEKILSSMNNKSTYDALSVADIRYLDGIGTVKLAERKVKHKLSRIPGCELWLELMKRAGELQLPVFILGSSNDVIHLTVKKLASEFNSNIVGFNDGYFADDDLMIERIIEAKPKILSVALGSPRQEIFMKKCKDKGLNCFMMGVGGTYNVYTGVVKRAPKIWCNLNLEWLYRLLCEPTRIKRQIKLLDFIRLSFLKKI